MTLPEQLSRLQQVDLELQGTQEELDVLESRLSDNRALAAAESRLASSRQELDDLRRQQKESEWELEDIQEKARRISSALYGGKTTNPKELVNLEKEAKMLTGQISQKEDTLLALLGRADEIQAQVSADTEECSRLTEEWQQRQKTLGLKRQELEAVLRRLQATRASIAQQIDSQALELYERIKQSRGKAVAKVERGRCQGCHITIPTSQWQKAKAGSIVQCGSCNRILSLD
jgi:uncharacterized protein